MMMEWKPLCPLIRYPISTWEGYNSFLVYWLRWCKLWIALLFNPWGPSASSLVVWNLLPPLVRQSEWLCFPPAQLWQKCVHEHKECRCLTLCVFLLVSPVPSSDMLQEPQGLWSAWPLLTLLQEGMGWNLLGSCGCWADPSPPAEGQHRDTPDLNLLGEWVRSWLPPNVPNPRGYDFILSLILLLVTAMLRTLLFSSFISSLFHCRRWSIQTKCKRKNFFILYTQMLLTSMCCPILKENTFVGSGAVRAAPSGPPTNLPEISWHFCFSLGFRHALVWFLCFCSPHTSDLDMFQY